MSERLAGAASDALTSTLSAFFDVGHLFGGPFVGSPHAPGHEKSPVAEGGAQFVIRRQPGMPAGHETNALRSSQVP